MSVNFQEIYEKIKVISQDARERRELIKNLRGNTHNLLEQHADELDYLWDIVERARGTDPNIRCAYPFNGIPRFTQTA